MTTRALRGMAASVFGLSHRGSGLSSRPDRSQRSRGLVLFEAAGRGSPPRRQSCWQCLASGPATLGTLPSSSPRFFTLASAADQGSQVIEDSLSERPRPSAIATRWLLVLTAVATVVAVWLRLAPLFAEFAFGDGGL